MGYRSSNVTWIPSGPATYDVPTPAGAQVGDVLIAFTRGKTGTVPTVDTAWSDITLGSFSAAAGRVLAKTVEAGDLSSVSWTLGTLPAAVMPVTAIVQVVLSGFVFDRDLGSRNHGLIEGLASWSWADPGSLTGADPTVTNLPAIRVCIAVGDCDTNPAVTFAAAAPLTTALSQNYHDADYAAAAIVAYQEVTGVGDIGSRFGSSSAKIGSGYGSSTPTERGWQWNVVFFQQPAPPIASPADETGWQLATVHRFSPDDFPSGIRGWFAPSPDGRYMYVASGSSVWRMNLGSYEIDESWSAVGANPRAIATDNAGNVYFINHSASIGKIDPTSGAVTSTWVTVPGGYSLNWLTAGRDGFLYVQAINRRVFRVSTAGDVTEVLELFDSFAARYDWIAVLSDGTIWLDLRPPPESGDNTTLRRYVPTSAVGLTANDSTFDPGKADSPPNYQVGRWWAPLEEFALDRVTSPAPVAGIGVMRLSVVDGSHLVGGPFFGDGRSTDTYEVAPGDDIHMSIFVRADPSNAAAGTYQMWAELDVYDDAGGFLAEFDSLPSAAVSEAGWTEFVVDGTMPAGARFVQMFCQLTSGVSGNLHTGDVFYFSFATANLRQRGTVTDFPIQAIEGSSGSHDQAQGGLFVDDADHLLVPMTDTAPAGAPLSWFLRVAPDGSATRVAGTWGYAGTPPPAPTATNVADGQLGVSLAADCQFACGITADGKTLYFVDDSDHDGGDVGDLLRVLTRGVRMAPARVAGARLHRVGGGVQ